MRRWTMSALLGNLGINLGPALLFLSGQEIPTANYVLSGIGLFLLALAIIVDRDRQRFKRPRNGLVVKEVIDAIKTDPDIDWVRHDLRKDKVQPLELWIPSIARWVRPSDGYISGRGEYFYARWLGRLLIRRAIAGRKV